MEKTEMLDTILEKIDKVLDDLDMLMYLLLLPVLAAYCFIGGAQ